MTDHDLATLVRAHVQDSEPPFLMSSDTVIALGRRTLVRRRARRGLAGVVVAAAAVAALPLMPWHGSGRTGDRTGIDPATAAALEHYDAQRMPQLIDDHARAALGAGLDGLGEGDFRASDDQGAKVPPQYYDKASSMSVKYGAHGGPRQVIVSLLHSRSEAEGDARKNCRNDLAAGYDFACTVTTSSNGDVVTTSVMAVRRQTGLPDATWAAVTRDELRTGVPSAGDPSQEPIDASEVYFIRNVESVHSRTFLTSAQEIVKAPSFEGAQQAFVVPVDALEQVVTDPELVMPAPPIGDNGCAWTMPGTQISCTKDPSAG
ncbi:hypothetical protein ACVW00_000200 [Marmoricola sp. URHA0025 HA25]